MTDFALPKPVPVEDGGDPRVCAEKVPVNARPVSPPRRSHSRRVSSPLDDRSWVRKRSIGKVSRTFTHPASACPSGSYLLVRGRCRGFSPFVRWVAAPFPRPLSRL